MKKKHKTFSFIYSIKFLWTQPQTYFKLKNNTNFLIKLTLVLLNVNQIFNLKKFSHRFNHKVTLGLKVVENYS